MNIEKTPKTYEKFLQAAFTVSDKAIEHWKKETIKQFRDRQKTSALDLYLNWKRKSNEIAVFTLYSLSDIKIPTEMDCIFRYDNPEIHIKKKFVISHCILDGWFPNDFIGKGHKHLCILTFEKEIPKIFSLLECDSDWTANDSILGLCKYEDIHMIIERRDRVQLLKQKHGEEWYNFDDDKMDGDA